MLDSCGFRQTAESRVLLNLEDEVFVVAVASSAANHGSDVSVDGLDDAEGKLVVAVAENTFEVASESGGELLERRKSLPPEATHPVLEEAESGCLVGVLPQALELLFKEVGFEQTPVERQGFVEQSSFGRAEVSPASEKQPALAAHGRPHGGTLAKELLSSGFIDRGVDVLHYVELVEDDGRSGQMLFHTLQVRLPHVHAHGAHRPSEPWRQLLVEKAVQGFLSAVGPRPERLAELQVGNHRQASTLPPEDLVDPHPSKRFSTPLPTPVLQAAFVDASNRLLRQPPSSSHSIDRSILAFAGDRSREPLGIRMFALKEVDALGLHSTARADDSMHLDDQPHLPLSPRQVSNPSLSKAVELADPDAAPPASMEGILRVLPNPHRQPQGRLVEDMNEDFVSVQPENPAYDLLGHRPSGLLSPFANEEKRFTTRGLARFFNWPSFSGSLTDSGQERKKLSS